ncbi:MAG: hypothetical protein ACFFCS_14000 [Candidatus Hodarchaeota archaeon]
MGKKKEVDGKKWLYLWIVLIAAGTAVMLLILLSGMTQLDFTFVIFLVTLKFLAGFGVIMGITGLVIFMFTKFEKKFKGKQNKWKIKAVFILALLIIIGLMIYQGPYKFWDIVTSTGGSDNIFMILFDAFLFIYGIFALILRQYAIPVWRNEFDDVLHQSLMDKIKDGWTEKVRGAKKRFFSWRKNYAKAYLQDQLSLKEYLKEWRRKFAIITLLFLGIGNLIFTVICVILIMTWYLVFIKKVRELKKYEKYLFIGACIALMVLVVLMAFDITLGQLYQLKKTWALLIQIAQFSGLIVGVILYLMQMWPIISSLEKGKGKEKDKEKEKKSKEKEKEKKKKDKEKEKEKKKENKSKNSKN